MRVRAWARNGGCMRAITLLLVPLTLCVATGCSPSWAWKQADLDRNRLNLALFRGAESASAAADWIEYGKVVESSGAATPGGGDLAITVRYERQETDWLGGAAGVERVCYRFTSRDGDNVQFSETDCPAA